MVDFLLTISDKSDTNCIQNLYLMSNDDMALGNIVYNVKQ